MRIILLILLLIVCGFVVAGQSPNESNEEYEVYNAVLESEKGILVIRDETGMDKDSRNIKDLENRGIAEIFKEVSSETLKEFLEKNETTEKLEAKFSTDINYEFISAEELKSRYDYFIDGDMNWELFNLQYPKTGKLFTLSRVGFSKDKKQAIMFLTFWCGKTCGEGEFYILKKENSKWKVVKTMGSWIS